MKFFSALLHFPITNTTTSCVISFSDFEKSDFEDLVEYIKDAYGIEDFTILNIVKD